MSKTNIGQVHLTAVNTNPTEVVPGGVSRTEVRLTETAEFVGPAGRLRLCNPGSSWGATGLEVRVVVTPSWGSEITETVCVPVFNVASGEVDLAFDLTAPGQVGEYQVSVRIESTKTDDISETVNNTVIVSEGDAADEGPTEGGSIIDDGGNVKDGGGLGFALENPLITGVGVVAGIVAVREGVSTLLGGE
jgi:hypothetical protein